MKIWFKEYKKGKMLRDCIIESEENDTRTHKVFNSLDKAARELDLAVPIWLDHNIADFKRNSRTRFDQDSFVEEIEFDYLEMSVIEEDDFIF